MNNVIFNYIGIVLKHNYIINLIIILWILFMSYLWDNLILIGYRPMVLSSSLF